MKLRKIPTDCDLSAAALDYIIKDIVKTTDLFVSSTDVDVGNELARQYGLTLWLDDSLPDGAWYVKGHYFGIFSPGA